METLLYDHQRAGSLKLARVLTEKRAALDASGTGTGKTHTACEAARLLGLPTGVVCPKQVRTKWRRTLAEFGVEPAFVEGWEKMRTGRLEWLSLSEGRFAWNLPKDFLIIWDEAQKSQGAKSVNGKMMNAAKAHVNLLLSATLAEDPMDMRAAGYLLGLHKLSDFYPWALRNGCFRAPWGGIAFRKGPARIPYLRKLHGEIFPERGVRVRQEDLGDLFPEQTIEFWPLDLEPGEIEKAQKALAFSTDAETSAITEILRERQTLELAKTGALVEMAEGELAQGRRVIIFVNFQRTIDDLGHLLRCPYIIDGRTDDRRRLEVQRMFLANEIPVVLLNTQAGGVAIDLHDTDGAHPRTAIHCPTYDAKGNQQALGRAFRAGGKSAVIQKIVYVPDTVEEEAVEALKRKNNNMEILHHGKLSPE